MKRPNQAGTITRNSVVFEVMDFVDLANMFVKIGQSMRKTDIPKRLIEKVTSTGHEYRTRVRILVNGRCWETMTPKNKKLMVTMTEEEARDICVLLSTVIVHLRKIGTENTDRLSQKAQEFYDLLQVPLSKLITIR